MQRECRQCSIMPGYGIKPSVLRSRRLAKFSDFRRRMKKIYNPNTKSGAETRMIRPIWSTVFKSAVSLAILLTAFSRSSQAQAPSPSPAQSVVTVTFNAAVLQTAEAQRALGALQTKYAPRQAQLKALNDEIAEQQKQLQATGDKLSDAERASREQSLNAKEKQFQRQSEDYKADSQTDSQQVFQTVAQKVYAFLQTYAREHGYSVVVERGTDAAPVVWYVAGGLDITEDLIKAYNAQSGTAAPASGNAPAAPRPNPANSTKPQPSSTPPK
jgi:outer membrane protein